MGTSNSTTYWNGLFKIIPAVCVLLLSGCISSKPVARTNHDSLEQALSQAASERVWHITIFYIPEQILPIEAIDAYRLEHGYSGCICSTRGKTAKAGSLPRLWMPSPPG
jgi:hypothetical protein